MLVFIMNMKTPLRKAGSNWVEGDRFFNREVELEALMERVHDGTHTLLTAQRRMGKTSLVRELLRNLEVEGDYATLFVDLEASNDAGDAIAEIATQARPLRSAWNRIRSNSANWFRGIPDHVDELGLHDFKLKFRAGLDAGIGSESVTKSSKHSLRTTSQSSSLSTNCRYSSIGWSRDMTTGSHLNDDRLRIPSLVGCAETGRPTEEESPS